MKDYQILFFVFVGAATVASLIMGWIESSLEHKAEIRRLNKTIAQQERIIESQEKRIKFYKEYENNDRAI